MALGFRQALDHPNGPVHQVDRLTEGLGILRKYTPDMSVYSTHRTRRVLEVQEEAFREISDADRRRLEELGWWTNGIYVWGF